MWMLTGETEKKQRGRKQGGKEGRRGGEEPTEEL